jgi:stage III sporulation protein AA
LQKNKLPKATHDNNGELERLLILLPKRIQSAVYAHPQIDKFMEVVLDLGRQPELRFHQESSQVLDEVVTREEIDLICNQLSGFSSENRAGIERTLHRISAIRNRRNQIIGLTCRVGKTTTGTVDLITDLLQQNKSILLLGPPGSGKTTRLREIAEIYADELAKRVIIIDTSNEIGGDGDIPHPSVGRARRMPVIDPSEQHKVMIEAVENHTPEVIVIDEISTPEEALAAQTIAERGVILIATAHGKDLESIVKNPSLSDLVGGSQSVTLSDEEAKRRKTQKTVLERSHEATFQIVVEIISHHSMVLHQNVNEAVDQILRGGAPLHAELRHSHPPKTAAVKEQERKKSKYNETNPYRIYPYAVSHGQIYAVIQALDLPAVLVDVVDEADLVIALEDYANPGAKIRKLANVMNIQLETIEHNNFSEIRRALSKAIASEAPELMMEDVELQLGLEEAHKAIEAVKATGKAVELTPRKSQIRKAQQELVSKSGFQTDLLGEGNEQHLKISEV